MDLFQKCYEPSPADQARAAGIYPYFHEISSKQHSEVIMDGRRTIMLGSNNYLGLTSDERVIDAACRALKELGAGCSGSRFLNGTLTLHKKLESELAEFLGKQAAMTWSTGFQTNLGIISALCGRHDIIFFDRANHASLMDASRLSFSKLVKYEHNDMTDLSQKLKDAPAERGKLIVVDGVFSMEGDLADLPEIVSLAKRYNARVMVDDSHGIGVLGAHGRGTAEYFGLEKEVDIIMGTFSKSFASLGGFMASEERVVDYAMHVSRPYIFSASIPPSNAAAALQSLEILKSEPERCEKLRKNGDYMREGFKKLGIPCGEGITPIVPVRTGTNERAFIITRALLENGVYVNPVISPAVPEGESILRTSYTATHTKEQLDFALEKFDLVFNKLYPAE